MAQAQKILRDSQRGSTEIGQQLWIYRIDKLPVNVQLGDGELTTVLVPWLRAIHPGICAILKKSHKVAQVIAI